MNPRTTILEAKATAGVAMAKRQAEGILRDAGMSRTHVKAALSHLRDAGPESALDLSQIMEALVKANAK
jgi:hypothetical protein